MGRLFPSHTHLSAGHSRHPPAGHLPVLRCNLATRWQTPNVSRAPTGRVSAAVQPCHPPADNRRYAGSHRPNIRRGATLPPAAFRRGAPLPPCPADTRRTVDAHRPGIRRGAITRRLSLRPIYWAPTGTGNHLRCKLATRRLIPAFQRGLPPSLSPLPYCSAPRPLAHPNFNVLSTAANLQGLVNHSLLSHPFPRWKNRRQAALHPGCHHHPAPSTTITDHLLQLRHKHYPLRTFTRFFPLHPCCRHHPVPKITITDHSLQLRHNHCLLLTLSRFFPSYPCCRLRLAPNITITDHLLKLRHNHCPLHTTFALLSFASMLPPSPCSKHHDY